MKTETSEGYYYDSRPAMLGWNAVIYDKSGNVIGSVESDLEWDIHRKVKLFIERHEREGE